MDKKIKSALDALQELNVIPEGINVEFEGFNHIKEHDYATNVPFIPEGAKVKETCVSVIKNVRWLLNQEVYNLNQGEATNLDQTLVRKLADIIITYAGLPRITHDESKILLVREKDGEFIKTKFANEINSTIEHTKNIFKELDAILDFDIKEADMISEAQENLKINIQEEKQEKISASMHVSESEAYMDKDMRADLLEAASNQDAISYVERDYFSELENEQETTVVWKDGYSKRRRITESGNLWSLPEKENPVYTEGFNLFVDKIETVLDMTANEDVRNFVKVKPAKNANLSIIN